ncbi:kinesin-like protein KIF20A [Panonychus citri]|uniref:kinesin-like protein KIF20A n=1 Tax=Panonychus citri TaxID=50023 RepID=UPI0023076520|nr:kinesin-like protein KIF20A [Panonychus citri]
MDPLSSSICVLDNSIELVDEFTNSTTNITTKSLLTSDDEKIATFLRIRPIDNFTIEESPYKIIDSNKIYIDEKTSSNCGSAKKINATRNVYNFTEILDESVNQLNVFSKCCLPLVEDVLDGNNGILFCYGTTSSGKSFTMRGSHEDPTVNPGLIPLSLKKIFSSRKFIDEPLLAKSKFCDMTLADQKTQDLEKQYKDSILASRCCRNVVYADVCNNNISFNEDGYQYICYLSYFEIYNELVYDLLNSSSGGRGTALSLSEDEKKRYYVKDLRSVMVSSLTEALKIYSYGWTNLQRNIQTTGLNQNSSRSHSFLCITLIKFSEDEGKILEPQISHLTLGDLAGSERQKKTNTEGCRTKEGGRINNSLMNLSRCIRILRNNQKNSNQELVPFRDSSLTKFLQPYFIGSGKAAIICNINPAANLVGETRTSLEFCGHVGQVNTNTLQAKSRFSMYSIPEERSHLLEDISYYQNKTNRDELHRLYAENTELKNRLVELEKENIELKLRDSEKIEVARKASIATSLGITLAHETSIQSISSCTGIDTQEENLRDTLMQSKTAADFLTFDESGPAFPEIGATYSNAQTQTDGDGSTHGFTIDDVIKIMQAIKKGDIPLPSNIIGSNQEGKKRGRPRRTKKSQETTKSTPIKGKKPLGPSNKNSARKSTRKSTRILTPDYRPKYVMIDRLARNRGDDNPTTTRRIIFHLLIIMPGISRWDFVEKAHSRCINLV